jgi:hypothetical protein
MSSNARLETVPVDPKGRFVLLQLGTLTHLPG